MYFPYLRGRQNELLAVKELVESKRLSSKVIPIIEPVRFSTQFINLLKTLIEHNASATIIKNPQVGDYVVEARQDGSGERLKAIRDAILSGSNFITAVISAPNAEESVNWLISRGVDIKDIMSICLNRDFIDNQLKIFGQQSKYNVIPYDASFRRIRGNRIQINDRFAPIKKERNVDYLSLQDEFFSDDHLFYKDDNYVGFSDYSIVGQDFQESGFAPYAVAIHIVYFDSDNILRIHHFVSDSNESMNDPAKKFYEAVSKLHKWNEDKKLNTLGIQAFEGLYEREAYPGLGVIKKLSIMHHLELMGNYLDNRRDEN